MRFSVVVAIALALSVTAAAQKVQKPKAKPSYSEEKESGKKGARAFKEPASHTSAAQELRRVEQSSARVATSRKSESNKAARTTPAFKTQKKDGNPPIHFSAASGSGKGSGKTANALKGRLRQKGRH